MFLVEKVFWAIISSIFISILIWTLARGPQVDDLQRRFDDLNKRVQRLEQLTKGGRSGKR